MTPVSGCGVNQSCVMPSKSSNSIAQLTDLLNKPRAVNGKNEQHGNTLLIGCGYNMSCETDDFSTFSVGCGYTMSCDPNDARNISNSNWTYFDGEFNWKNAYYDFGEKEFGYMPLEFSLVNYEDDKGRYKQNFGVGTVEIGFKADWEKINKIDFALQAEASSVSYESNVVLGNDDFAWTGGPSVSGPSAQGCGGICDSSVGFYGGASWVEGGLHTGFNILGFNIGIEGEARVGVKGGIRIGKKTKVDAGIFSIGLTIDEAK